MPARFAPYAVNPPLAVAKPLFLRAEIEAVAVFFLFMRFNFAGRLISPGVSGGPQFQARFEVRDVAENKFGAEVGPKRRREWLIRPSLLVLHD